MNQNSDPNPKLGHVHSGRALRAQVARCCAGRVQQHPGRWRSLCRSCAWRPRSPGLVATPRQGRNANLPCPAPTQVATPPRTQAMLRHRFQVATSFLPTMGFPGRDIRSQVATSNSAAHVATPKACHDIDFGRPAVPVLQHQIQAMTPLGYHPCRDVKFMSRPGTNWSQPW